MSKQHEITSAEFMRLLELSEDLPENLSVGGYLDLEGTQITSLPENLSVGGYLDLRGTQITSLPENLSVGGSLYLRGTQITSLPENLSVGGYLDLEGTQITDVEWFSEPVGEENRTGPVFMNRGEPHVILGCFNGNEERACDAIQRKYGDGSRYEQVVKEAFARFREKRSLKAAA